MPPPVVITFEPLPTVPYEPGRTRPLAAVSSDGKPLNFFSSDESIASVSGSVATIVKPGTVTITATTKNNPNASPKATQTFTIEKATQTITFAAPASPTTAADGLTMTLSATSDSGLPVTVTSQDSAVATVSNLTLTKVGAGTATLRATQAGDEYYEAATFVDQTVTIEKAPQTLSVSGLSSPKSVGASTFSLTVSSNAGLSSWSTSSSDTSVATVAGLTIDPGSPGTTTITVTEPGDALWEAATWTGSLTVSEVVDTSGSGDVDTTVDGDVTYDAPSTSGQKYMRLEVPNYDSSGATHPLSYIQLGSARTDGDSVRRGDDMLEAIGLTSSTTHFFRDDWRYSNGAQHPQTKYHRRDGLTDDDRKTPQELTGELLSRGGWREHTDGNRITTTRGDRVEVIAGNYRMVVLGRMWSRSGSTWSDNGWGSSYWESSGGHNKDATNTPGEVVHIGWKASESEQSDSYASTWKVFEETVKGKVINEYWGNQYEWNECDWIYDKIGSRSSVGKDGSEGDIPVANGDEAQKQTDQASKWLNATGRKKINPDITEVTSAKKIDTKTDCDGTIDEYAIARDSHTDTTTVGGTIKSQTFAGVITDEKGHAWSEDQPGDGTVSYGPIHLFKEGLHVKNALVLGEYGLVKLEVATGAMHWSNGGMGFTFNLAGTADFTLGVDTAFTLAAMNIGVNLALATELEIAGGVECNIGVKFKYATKHDGIGMTSQQLSMLDLFTRMKEDKMTVAKKVTSFFKNMT